MNVEELGKVLTKIQLGDNRQVDRAVLLEWRDSIGDLPFEDCIEAVTRHRRDTDAYLMPAHIVGQVRIIQREQDRAERIANARPAISGPVSTFDRAEHDRIFQASLRATRISKGMNPDTGVKER